LTEPELTPPPQPAPAEPPARPVETAPAEVPDGAPGAALPIPAPTASAPETASPNLAPAPSAPGAALPRPWPPYPLTLFPLTEPAPPAPIPAGQAPSPHLWQPDVALLLGLALASSLLKQPYVMTMLSPVPVRFPGVFGGLVTVLLAMLNALFEGALVFVAAWCGLALRRGLGLPRPWLAARALGLAPPGSWRPPARVGLAAGAATGALVLAEVALGPTLEPLKPLPTTAVWQDLLAIVGAGVGEEMLFRLGALTLFAWLGVKLLRAERPGPLPFWSANLLAGLCFALVHLPQTSALFHLTFAVAATRIGTAMLLGVVCGWLYWRFDLLAAMAGHAAYDAVLFLGSWIGSWFGS
jgi:membrane protease YdiL (CAAX protease family)